MNVFLLALSMVEGLTLCADAPGGDGDEPPARRRVLPLAAREAVSLSLNHNLDIEVARYQSWIEDQNVFAALGTWDHVAYATASEGHVVSQGFSFLSGATRLQNNSTSFTLGLRKSLPFGPSYDVSFTNERTESNNSFLLINPRWTQSAGATLTLPLLKGASATANTFTLVVARHARDISVDAFEKTLSDSVYLTLQTYWDLVFAVENKKVKDQSLEVALKLLDDNRRKFERGVVARIDVTQADAGVAMQQEGILTAEAAVLNSMDRLKRLIDPSLLREEVILQPVEAPRGLQGELDEKAAVEKSLEEALSRRAEVRQLGRQIASQGVILAKAENDGLPRVDVVGRGYVNGTDDGFSRANRFTRSADFYDVSVLLSFEWALEGSAARGALNRAELEMRRYRLQQRNLEDQILMEVREAVRAIKTNEKRIEATRRARVLAQDQLDGELTRREQGLSTTFRVLDVQEDLVQARTNEIKALIDYNLSWHKLHQSEGTLLERNGILIKENLQPRLAASGR